MKKGPKSARKASGRNGVSTRVANNVAGRLRNVRALWLAVQNDPLSSVADVATEFYYAIGEVLEGRELSALSLRLIDRKRMMLHIEE